MATAKSKKNNTASTNFEETLWGTANKHSLATTD